MANLLGAAFVVLNNRTATKKEAEKWVKLHSTMLKNLALAHEEDDSADCLNHLLQSTLRIQEIGETTIGQLLNECAATAHLQGNDDTETLLTRHGIKPMKNGFLVANKHKELNRIFNGTLWENGAWKAALRRIQGAKADDKTRARFSGGGVVRCVLVPYKI